MQFGRSDDVIVKPLSLLVHLFVGPQSRGAGMKGEPYAPLKSIRFWRSRAEDAGAAAVVRAVLPRCHRGVLLRWRYDIASSIPLCLLGGNLALWP